MKRILALLLGVVLLVGLCGCDSKKDDGPTKGDIPANSIELEEYVREDIKTELTRMFGAYPVGSSVSITIMSNIDGEPTGVSGTYNIGGNRGSFQYMLKYFPETDTVAVLERKIVQTIQ